MPTKSRGIRIPEELDQAISSEANVRGTSWSAMSTELLREALEMRHAPGILFADGPAGRRAVVAGTGLDVWEVIASWNATNRDYSLFRRSYPQLSETQLRAALGYYDLYPDHIDSRIAREASWTPERLRQELPFAVPGPPRS